MSINSPKDFFKSKKEWSVIKDNLLSWYLTPYLSKIFVATNHFYLIDGFAGPGLFEDGKKGSPMIESELLEERYSYTKNKNVKFRLICIEKDKTMYDRLVVNTSNKDYVDRYNDEVDVVLSNILPNLENRSCVFVYLDPFGIKGFPYNVEKVLTSRSDVKAELLVNFNSFGCYRECKRLVGEGKEFESYFNENPIFLDSKSTKERMNMLLGTDSWVDIIKMDNPEYQLSLALCKKFKATFKYVLNMPIKTNKGEIPKYRMIYCTNSSYGAVLMADNMLKQMKRQKLLLFNTNLEGDIVEPEEYIPKIMDLIPKSLNNSIRLNEVLMQFYEKYGVLCETSEIINFLKSEEKKGLLNVIRKPDVCTNGKKSSFWTEGDGKIISLRQKITISQHIDRL